MLYERKLSMIPKGWGLTGQKFFYQEDDSEDKVFEVYMLDAAGESLKIHKIILPGDIRRIQKDDGTLTNALEPKLEINEAKQHQLLTKINHVLDDSEHSKVDEHLPDLQEDALNYLQNHDNRVAPQHHVQDEDDLSDGDFRIAPSHFKKALARQSEKLTKRMNKKINVNLAYIDGRVIMATKYALVELKVNKLLEK